MRKDAATPARPVHRVAVLALPNVVAIDLAVPAQVFGHPAEAGDYAMTVCAAEPGEVPVFPGFTVLARHGLDALAAADTVIVPGYQPHTDPPEPVLAALRAAAARGTRLVSICTGAFALAAAGLLDGLRATTHWASAAELARRYPRVRVDPDVLYVDEGRILTSAGVAAGLDLCVHLVRLDHGSGRAARVARQLVVAPHRSGGQAQHLQRPVPAGGGTGTAATCAWALARLHERLTVAELARHAHCSPRTFARRFTDETGSTPLRWLTAQRLLRARQLLETTELGVDEIARRTGTGTAANLRLLFARDAATTPTAYRAAHRGRALVS